MTRTANKNQKKFHDAIYSSWTPLVNKEAGYQFNKWNRQQQNELLDDMVNSCSKSQLIRLKEKTGSLVTEPRLDFTRKLPRIICLYIFSYLDPRSLCRASQVSWYWHYLADANEVWAPKCLRLGWIVNANKSGLELGIWKKVYIENIQFLRLGSEKQKQVVNYTSKYSERNGFDDTFSEKETDLIKHTPTFSRQKEDNLKSDYNVVKKSSHNRARRDKNGYPDYVPPRNKHNLHIEKRSNSAMRSSRSSDTVSKSISGVSVNAKSKVAEFIRANKYPGQWQTPVPKYQDPVWDITRSSSRNAPATTKKPLRPRKPRQLMSADANRRPPSVPNGDQTAFERRPSLNDYEEKLTPMSVNEAEMPPELNDAASLVHVDDDEDGVELEQPATIDNGDRANAPNSHDADRQPENGSAEDASVFNDFSSLNLSGSLDSARY